MVEGVVVGGEVVLLGVSSEAEADPQVRYLSNFGNRLFSFVCHICLEIILVMAI